MKKQTVRTTLSVSSFHGSNKTEAAHSRTGPEIVEVLGSKKVASFSVEKLATLFLQQYKRKQKRTNPTLYSFVRE